MTKREEKSLAAPEAPAPDRMVVSLKLPMASEVEVLAKNRQLPDVGFTPMDILLVDDNPGDARIMMEALKESLPAARLSVTTDGIEAMQFLRREGRYHRAPRPDLIFLDLRLPKLSGFLVNIPIIVQSSSEAQADVERAYSLHANCYITKLCDLDEFSRTIRVLTDFWMTIAKMPDGRCPSKSN